MMNRIQTSCYALIASAIFLTGLLVGMAGLRMTSNAQGEMVIAQQNFSLMTSRTRPSEESLFVLDNKSGRLLIYSLNLVRERFELEAGIDLSRIFGGGGNTGGGGGGGGR